jgi:hypothetical protein
MIRDVPSRQLHALKDDRQDDRQDEILATIPQEGGATALEVAMTHDAPNDLSIELRYLVWGRSLGWYRQQTIKLDGAAARDLIRALGVVQRRVERQLVEGLGSNVLPFPHPRAPQHPAASA